MTSARTRNHILAGDDSPEILMLLRDLLEADGFRVSVSATALTLEEIRRVQPDLIILDHMLEDGAGSGWELLRGIRLDAALHTMPVVICTGAIQRVRDGQAEIDALGAEVVFKPFDIEQLLTAVHTALASTPA